MEHRNLFKIGKEPANKKWNTDTLIKEYKRVKRSLGHIPSWDELREHSKAYPSIFQKRFGTLDNLSKLAYPSIDLSAPKIKWDISDLNPEDGGWLSGICAGEGCFRISMNLSARRLSQFGAIFHMQLRADDIGVLEEIKRLWRLDTRIGIWNREHDRKRGINAGDGCILTIRNIPVIVSRILPTFEKYPMRSKKQSDFVMFKRGVEIMNAKRLSGNRNSQYTDEQRSELERIYWTMRELKKYNTDAGSILENHPAVRVGF